MGSCQNMHGTQRVQKILTRGTTFKEYIVLAQIRGLSSVLSSSLLSEKQRFASRIFLKDVDRQKVGLIQPSLKPL